MIISQSEKVSCAVAEAQQLKILHALEEQFQKISKRCVLEGAGLKVEGIRRTFGSAERKDTTTVTVKPNSTNDGYFMATETIYKPSLYFWISLIIGVILVIVWGVEAIAILAGLLLGGVGFYLYNKSVVTGAIVETLKKVKDEME